eukprot:TRINITY_DN67227_c9_g1_i1.p1 TRINITY_DN67227_c9_g1~~TRINITY_DN67227_c9_g1_i1.p1  ORF type:complete len:135 (+),score=18.78 TRINITY_DN67227_c9_g1_i1:30-434(+)
MDEQIIADLHQIFAPPKDQATSFAELEAYVKKAQENGTAVQVKDAFDELVLDAEDLTQEEEDEMKEMQDWIQDLVDGEGTRGGRQQRPGFVGGFGKLFGGFASDAQAFAASAAKPANYAPAPRRRVVRPALHRH